MFKLPFHLEGPLELGGTALALAVIVGILRWTYIRNVSIGRLLRWYFERRFRVGGVPNEERSYKAGWWLMTIFLATFLVMAAFGFFVASGLIKNGDPPPPVTVEEFLRQHTKRVGCVKRSVTHLSASFRVIRGYFLSALCASAPLRELLARIGAKPSARNRQTTLNPRRSEWTRLVHFIFHS